MSVVIAIPARMSSSRFPGKPLCDLMGKPMIQWVVEAAKNANIADRVVVATPDQAIIEACAGFGAEAILTRSDHLSGTDRLAELAARESGDIWVNVQGDEPLIRPETISLCAKPLLRDSQIPMASVFSPCDAADVENPAVVKVVTDLAGNALYFSRHGIPFARNERREPLKRHVGIYAYRREVLLQFARWSPTPLEQTESLEQLRFVENGVPIRMSPGETGEFGVDTPEQADAVRRILESAAKGSRER